LFPWFLIFIKVYFRGINCQLDLLYLHINPWCFSLLVYNPYFSECHMICVVLYVNIISRVDS
jgi:hypothetical protein